jgi:MATE family multidrug resistance protein
VVAAQLAAMLMGFVDTALLGRFSVEALAASSLANVWIFGTLMLANGVIFGIDPIVSQAHGAGEGARAALALQRGMALALALSIPVALLWLGSETFLVATGQDPALARAAQRYTVIQIPSIPCFLGYATLRQYLQGRELVRPGMWVIAIANVVNGLLAYLLIFGGPGIPSLGIVGAAIATTVARVLAFAGLVAWVRWLDLHRGAWVPWSRAALDPRGHLEILRLGVPVALQVGLEMWAFSGAALLAGRLGTVSLAAHTIVLNMAALAFMIPLGVSQGAVIRVGNLLGAGRPAAAQRAAWVALGVGAGVMTFSAAAFVLFRHALPRIYTPDAAVVALSASILPIAAAFQIFDGTQVVGCGILRGMGQTRPAAVFNLVGYWVLALPVGGWLALATPAGLPGLWWGLCFGLAVVAASLVAWIARRGPGHDLEARVRVAAPDAGEA